MGSILFLLIVIILVLWILASCIRIVPQAYAIVLERLGAYQATWGTGVHFKLPFVERVARKVNLKEQVVDFPPQPVITKDNVDEAEFWGNFDLEDGYWSETANTWNTYAIE